MWAEILGWVAAPVLTAAAMAWLFRDGGREAPVVVGAMVLRYPKALAWLGAVIALIGVVILAALAVGEGGVVSLGADALAVTLVFGVPGLAFVAFCRREHVIVSLDGIESHGVLGGVRVLRWSDVERVSFGRMSSALTFHGTDGTRLRASAYLVGIVALAEVVERRLHGRGGAQAARDLLAYRQSFGGVPKR